MRKAQHLGAIGVIIADHTCLCSDVAAGVCTKTEEVQCEQVEPIMADDGSGADILIPRYVFMYDVPCCCAIVVQLACLPSAATLAYNVGGGMWSRKRTT